MKSSCSWCNYLRTTCLLYLGRWFCTLISGLHFGSSTIHEPQMTSYSKYIGDYILDQILNQFFLFFFCRHFSVINAAIIIIIIFNALLLLVNNYDLHLSSIILPQSSPLTRAYEAKATVLFAPLRESICIKHIIMFACGTFLPCNMLCKICGNPRACGSNSRMDHSIVSSFAFLLVDPL